MRLASRGSGRVDVQGPLSRQDDQQYAALVWQYTGGQAHDGGWRRACTAWKLLQTTHNVGQAACALHAADGLMQHP